MDGFSRSNIFSILFLFNIFNDFRPKNGLKEIVEEKQLVTTEAYGLVHNQTPVSLSLWFPWREFQLLVSPSLCRLNVLVWNQAPSFSLPRPLGKDSAPCLSFSV